MPLDRPEPFTEERPWGSFRQFVLNRTCTVKILRIGANQAISKQSHSNRSEFWVILDDGIKVEIGGKTWLTKEGDELFIPKGSIHRLSSGRGGRWLEISLGDFDENDYVRHEDKYGRI